MLCGEENNPISFLLKYAFFVGLFFLPTFVYIFCAVTERHQTTYWRTIDSIWSANNVVWRRKKVQFHSPFENTFTFICQPGNWFQLIFIRFWDFNPLSQLEFFFHFYCWLDGTKGQPKEIPNLMFFFSLKRDEKKIKWIFWFFLFKNCSLQCRALAAEPKWLMVCDWPVQCRQSLSVPSSHVVIFFRISAFNFCGFQVFGAHSYTVYKNLSTKTVHKGHFNFWEQKLLWNPAE